MQVNSIDEKLLIKQYPLGNWLEIRRLPMDCSDSRDQMWEKNWEDHKNLPLVNLY